MGSSHKKTPTGRDRGKRLNLFSGIILSGPQSGQTNRHCLLDSLKFGGGQYQGIAADAFAAWFWDVPLCGGVV